MQFLTTSFIALAFVIGSSASLAASLEDNLHFKVDTRTAMVKFSDLNLADSADKQTLLERVQSTAREICKREGDIRQLNAKREQELCLEESYRKALIAINSRTGTDLEPLATRPTASRALVAE